MINIKLYSLLFLFFLKTLYSDPIEIDGDWCEIDTVQDLERAKKLFS